MLEDQIRTHPTLKDYGAERIFGTRLEIKDGTVIAKDIIKTFHQDFAPNAIVLRSVLPKSRRRIDVVRSQGGELDVAALLMELKLKLEQYALKGDHLNNSSINLASNDVPRIAATLSLLTTQFDESYIGNLHFDTDGKLMVPILGLNDLEPAAFYTKLATLLQSEDLKGIPSNQLFGIVKHTSDIRLSDVIQNRMNLEQLKGSLVTKVRYAVDQTLVIQGIDYDLKVRNTSVIIQKLDQRSRESNDQALQATIDELDKLLESNPTCSAIWYLRAFCYFKQDPESPLVIRSLYNIIAIEARYPREIGLRGQNTFELNNMSTILLRSKLTSLKNVEEDVPAIHKAFYKTIKNSTCLGHGSISNRSMKNLIARFIYLSFLTSYRLFFFETTSV